MLNGAAISYVRMSGVHLDNHTQYSSSMFVPSVSNPAMASDFPHACHFNP